MAHQSTAGSVKWRAGLHVATAELIDQFTSIETLSSIGGNDS